MAIPSTSQGPAHAADCRRYLEDGVRSRLDRLGFAAALHDDPAAGFGPILLATRVRGPGPAHRAALRI